MQEDGTPVEPHNWKIVSREQVQEHIKLVAEESREKNGGFFYKSDVISKLNDERIKISPKELGQILGETYFTDPFIKEEFKTIKNERAYNVELPVKVTEPPVADAALGLNQELPQFKTSSIVDSRRLPPQGRKVGTN